MFGIFYFNIFRYIIYFIYILNLTIKEFVPDYISSLRAKAKSLITTAKAKGWTDLFHGGRFSPQNMNFLKRKLIDMKNYQWVWKSTGNVQQGFTENDLKCVVPGHELKLVFDSGYTMSPNLTPLSLVVLLEKIENDMQL